MVDDNDRQTPEDGYIMSSLREPNGSGKLIKYKIMHNLPLQ